MRARVWTAALLLLAGCSPARDTGSANNMSAIAPVPTPTVAKPTAGALGAKQVVAQYFAKLSAHDDRAAYRMWGGNGADTRGSLAQFTAANRVYARYDGSAGQPTLPRVVDGVEYITVEAGADTLIKGGKPIRRTGVVMLRRPARPDAATNPDGWAIWGSDLRDRHCRPGQQAKAFGC